MAAAQHAGHAAVACCSHEEGILLLHAGSRPAEQGQPAAVQGTTGCIRAVDGAHSNDAELPCQHAGFATAVAKTVTHTRTMSAQCQPSPLHTAVGQEAPRSRQ